MFFGALITLLEKVFKKTDNGIMKALAHMPAEATLIPTIKANRKRIAPNTNLTECEVDSGFGIADVVFFNLDTEASKRREGFKSPPIKSFEILETFSVINRFNSNKINITHLYKQLPYSERVFKKKILSFFEEYKIAENIDNTYLKMRFSYKIPLQETVAIEAKVANWKRGLYQAYRYKQYANYSYLALHTNYVKRAIKHLDLFQSLNVGLLGVNGKEDSLEIIYKPKEKNPFISEKIKYFASENILHKQGFISSY